DPAAGQGMRGSGPLPAGGIPLVSAEHGIVHASAAPRILAAVPTCCPGAADLPGSKPGIHRGDLPRRQLGATWPGMQEALSVPRPGVRHRPRFDPPTRDSGLREITPVVRLAAGAVSPAAGAARPLWAFPGPALGQRNNGSDPAGSPTSLRTGGRLVY